MNGLKSIWNIISVPEIFAVEKEAQGEIGNEFPVQLLVPRSPEKLSLEKLLCFVFVWLISTRVLEEREKLVEAVKLLLINIETYSQKSFYYPVSLFK